MDHIEQYQYYEQNINNYHNMQLHFPKTSIMNQQLFQKQKPKYRKEYAPKINKHKIKRLSGLLKTTTDHRSELCLKNQQKPLDVKVPKFLLRYRLLENRDQP